LRAKVVDEWKLRACYFLPRHDVELCPTYPCSVGLFPQCGKSGEVVSEFTVDMDTCPQALPEFFYWFDTKPEKEPNN
jgi:hypothetical protein